MNISEILSVAVVSAFLLPAIGCPADGGEGDGEGSVAETPPEGHDAVQAWLAEGHYLDWACEPTVHASRDPSPHGRNRICSNAALAAAADTAPYPVGVAGVKELINDADEIIGFAVYRKAVADPATADGTNWYWYENVAPGTELPTPDPVKPNGVVADSRGSAGGNALTVCIDCHSHADNDFVFTQVKN